MRHLFVAFLIALLPLRGWVGDAMATSMAADHAQHMAQVATKIIATDTHQTGEKAHFDPETVAVKATLLTVDCSGHDLESVSLKVSAHCDSCSACQACHAVALSLTSVDSTAAFNVSTLPRAAAAQFASASIALGKKPPIS